MVKIVADTQKLEEKDEIYFSNMNFDLVCSLIDDSSELERINNICRKNNVLFLCGHVYGMFGYLFVDLNDYSYIEEAPKILDETSEKKKPFERCSSDEKSDEKKVFEEKVN
jgi:ubiquitin-like 1-activating enzyme E1 A